MKIKTLPGWINGIALFLILLFLLAWKFRLISQDLDIFIDDHGLHVIFGFAITICAAIGVPLVSLDYRKGLLWSALLIFVGASLHEIAQLWIEDRTADYVDWWMQNLGISIGLIWSIITGPTIEKTRQHWRAFFCKEGHKRYLLHIEIVYDLDQRIVPLTSRKDLIDLSSDSI